MRKIKRSRRRTRQRGRIIWQWSQRPSFNLLDSLLKRCVSFVYIHNFLKGHMKTHKSLVVQSLNFQVFTHPSINMAQFCLTSGIRRELLFSTRYCFRCYKQAMPSLHQNSDVADKEKCTITLFGSPDLPHCSRVPDH